ncbi:hypothetical protein CCUS01_15701 [Colletotrichum cuscutae]|uniref:Uncharacterized protein n=1 Tax=Colletotrichum cuscutae TaxID=1209917 RepID=A0AAI9Y5F0_9PEZI|nr:hypothetical protein CCUS01_15701 [Colletotrichum cuscutae]
MKSFPAGTEGLIARPGRKLHLHPSTMGVISIIGLGSPHWRPNCKGDLSSLTAARGPPDPTLMDRTRTIRVGWQSG